MVFQKTDIYTSSGSTMLFNSWTPYVSKFDTSSFYNWEQDNLPLYDLEERTFEMWEQGGYPTSAVPGMALTVSGDTPAATLAANGNIFTTVSACIAALPKVIRFPILIEVANFGDLGDLELHNFKIEEAGSIEIINRGYTKVYNSSAVCTDVIAAPPLNSYTPLMKEFTSQDVSATMFNELDAGTCTSAVHISTRVLNSGGDTRMNAVNSFIYPNFSLREAPLAVCLEYASIFSEDVLNEFRVLPYENQADITIDATIGTNDVSAVSQSTGGDIKRLPVTTATGQWVGGSVYFNTLDKLSIKNCDGPIYVRNFCVNGDSGPNVGRDVGIEVTNSDVVLENCAAARCRNAGFKFNNSKVVLSRSAFSYRNYALTAAATRTAQTGIGFHAVNSDVSISSLMEPHGTTGVAGAFQASGADTIVAASRNYIGFKLDNSQLHGGFQRIAPTIASSAGFTTAEVNTGYGIVANNSEIDLKGLIDVYGNGKGIELDNSKLQYEELCVEDHEGEGFRSRNSVARWDSPTTPGAAGQQTRYQVDFARNAQHIDLQKQSEFVFARKNHTPEIFGSMSFSGAQGVIKWSGANKAILPAISVNDNSVLDLLQPRIITRAAADSVASVPAYGQAIKATNNSTMSLFGTGNGCNFVWGTPGYTYQTKAAGLYADNQSVINLYGPTVIAQFGVDALVEDQSTLNMGPPRVRDAYGVEASAFDLSAQKNHPSMEFHSTRACLVANKNSTINMTDLGAYPTFWDRTPNGLGQLAAGVDYPIGTVFDNSGLFSSGSCQFFPNPQDALLIADLFLADLTNAGGLNFTIGDIPVFTTASFMNTYLVNDNPVGSTPDFSERQKVSQGGVCVRATADSVVNVKNVHFGVAPFNNPLDGHYYDSSGTDCEKLMIWNMADTSRLNASYCSVSGMWPGDTQYHGPSAIWTSSRDGEGWGNNFDVPASGAPARTPDTGSLSVLDAFGAGSSVWLIPSGVSFNSPFNHFYPVSAGFDNMEMASAISEAGINVSGFPVEKHMVWGAAPNTSLNRGMFRIYWSPKSSAKFLQSDLSGYFKGACPYDGQEGGVPGDGPFPFSGVVGPPYQIFSQGYNCSAPLSATVPLGDSSVSSIHPELVKLSIKNPNDGDWCPVNVRLWTSGFYYCEEFVESNPTQTMLDESAADTFANAKNASVGLAGRPIKVTLYRSRDDTSRSAEAYPGDASGGQGFKSSNIFDLTRDN